MDALTQSKDGEFAVLGHSAHCLMVGFEDGGHLLVGEERLGLALELPHNVLIDVNEGNGEPVKALGIEALIDTQGAVDAGGPFSGVEVGEQWRVLVNVDDEVSTEVEARCWIKSKL